MKQWVVGIGSSLIAGAIAAFVARVLSAMPDAGTLWRHYWPVAVGVLVAAACLGGYWLWRRAQRMRDDLGKLQKRVARLEEWPKQWVATPAGAFASRMIESEIDPKRGGMDVKP